MAISPVGRWRAGGVVVSGDDDFGFEFVDEATEEAAQPRPRLAGSQLQANDRLPSRRVLCGDGGGWWRAGSQPRLC